MVPWDSRVSWSTKDSTSSSVAEYSETSVSASVYSLLFATESGSVEILIWGATIAFLGDFVCDIFRLLTETFLLEGSERVFDSGIEFTDSESDESKDGVFCLVSSLILGLLMCLRGSKSGSSAVLS